MAEARFAKRLADLLRRRGMTQKELAERVGVTESAMSRYMSGERLPRSAVLANIATTLRSTSDYLLGTEQEGNLESDFPRIVRLIARNSAKMTKEQKSEIINTLLEED